MGVSRRSLRFAALSVVVALPLLGTAGPASAKAAKGCHKTHTCESGGGTATGGASPGPMTIQVDPNPLVETSESAIAAVVQVETSPAMAGDTVDITSSQLDTSCTHFTGYALSDAVSGNFATFGAMPLVIPLVLDDDGNAAADLFGEDCAPGSDVLEASMTTAPYYTALATLVANPPVVTTSGVFGFPTTSGTVTSGEVETGTSDVYAVFYVETDPVYAEQTVELDMAQLADRCQAANQWIELESGYVAINQIQPGGVVTSTDATLDDDGNAVVLFAGSSCAAGPSVVTADVLAGSHPTYTTTFNVVAPQPTI
jgi:hypothetical protein